MGKRGLLFSLAVYLVSAGAVAQTPAEKGETPVPASAAETSLTVAQRWDSNALGRSRD